MIGGLHVTSFNVGQNKVFPDNEVLVATAIEQSNANKLEAGWRLALNEESLKIVDVYVQQYSATGHFNDKISRGTQTNISGIISKLKNQLEGSSTLKTVASRM